MATEENEPVEKVLLNEKEWKTYNKYEAKAEKKSPSEPQEEQPHKAGVTTRIRERLEEAKQNINPRSTRNKSKNAVNQIREQKLRDARQEGYEEAEIQSAKNAGRHAAERKYAPHSSPKFRSPGSSLEAGLFGSSKGGLDFGLFWQAPKKKPIPVRTTVYNPRTGKVVTTEPIVDKPQKGFAPKEKAWSPWDMVSGPELHVKGIPNQLNFNVGMAPAPKGHKKGKKSRHQPPHKNGYRIGDLIY